MTTPIKISLHCPCCGETFESRSLLSTNNFGPQSTDFHQRAAGFQPLPLYIHTCTTCGFTGFSEDFEGALPTETIQLINKHLRPLIQGETPTSARRYEYAAWISKWQQREALRVADLYLRAAWCSEDEGRKEEELRYRRLSVEVFQEALAKNLIPDDSVPTITYLVGELYRRLGDKQTADEWFDRLPELCGTAPDKKWVLDLANQQKTAPQEFMERTPR